MKYTDLLCQSQSGKYHFSHSSYARGYVSRKLKAIDYPVEEYAGRFGNGYKVLKPNWKSTQYMIVEYWVE